MDNFFTSEALKLLESPLSSSDVKNRQQGGARVEFIEGWYALNQANRIFGHGRWQRETVLLNQITKNEYQSSNSKAMIRVGYMAKVRISVIGNNGEVIAREGYGTGDGRASDEYDAHELAIKEAETDATKRALATFGNQFGLALYDKQKRNVANIENTGNVNIIQMHADIIEVISELDKLSEYYEKYKNVAGVARMIAKRKRELEVK